MTIPDRLRVLHHDWEVDASPGIITWRCIACDERVMLTAISAARPERLRSTLVILESITCRP